MFIYLGWVTLPSGPLPNSFSKTGVGGDGWLFASSCSASHHLYIDEQMSTPSMATLGPHWSVCHLPSPKAGKWWQVMMTHGRGSYWTLWISPSQMLWTEESHWDAVWYPKELLLWFLFSVTHMYFANYSCNCPMLNWHKGWWTVSNPSASALKALRFFQGPWYCRLENKICRWAAAWPI